MLEADNEAVEEWLLGPKYEAQLFLMFPCTDITPSLANKVHCAEHLDQVLCLCPRLPVACILQSSAEQFNARSVANAVR